MPGLSGEPAANPFPAFDAGAGSVRVALLLPMSGEPGMVAVGTALGRAARMAFADLPEATVHLRTFDTGGTAGKAAVAAREALNWGARLVTGPMFAHQVRTVAGETVPAKVPVIAFSSDVTVAAPGVYLLSFPPQLDVRRIAAHAIDNGHRAFAALLPSGSYGRLAATTLRGAVRPPARVVGMETYGDGARDLADAVERIAIVAGGTNPRIDALLVPDGPSVLATLAPMVRQAGIDSRFVQLLGSGQWNEPAAWRIDELSGGRFAAPAPEGWIEFSRRYRERYASSPPRTATLAYDAVSLAAALARMGGADPFSEGLLTSRDGFAGLDGVFRFRRGGGVDRRLAILEIGSGSVRVRDAADEAFGDDADAIEAI